MISTFASEVRLIGEALTQLEEELTKSNRRLWKASEIAQQGDAFCQLVGKFFEDVIIPDEDERTVEVAVEVETWEYIPARRRRPASGLARFLDLIRTLLGLAPPLADYLRSIRRVHETQTIRAKDTRVLNGGSLMIQGDVCVRKPKPPELTLPTGRRRFRFGRGRLAVSVSEKWLHAVEQSWLRLSSRSIPDEMYEPRLVEVTQQRSAQTSELRVADLSPVAQSYLRRRRELEDDVRNVTGFLHHWNDHVQALSASTRGLLDQTSAIESGVKALPKPDSVQTAFEILAQGDGRR